MDRKVSWTASDISGSTLDTRPTSLMEGRREKSFLPFLRIGSLSVFLTLGVEPRFVVVVVVVVIVEVSWVEIVILLGRDRVEAGQESGGQQQKDEARSSAKAIEERGQVSSFLFRFSRVVLFHVLRSAKIVRDRTRRDHTFPCTVYRRLDATVTTDRTIIERRDSFVSDPRRMNNEA